MILFISKVFFICFFTLNYYFCQLYIWVEIKRSARGAKSADCSRIKVKCRSETIFISNNCN